MTVTIDGKAVACSPGEYLLEVAKRNGIIIPSLCNHGGMDGQGCCRVCLVEAETDGRRDLVTACVYPLERDCAVFTDSDRVKKHRRMVLALLRSRAQESEDISKLCEKYDVREYSRFSVRDGNGKCILCGLCVKACENLGTAAISTVHRGVDKKVSTPFDEPAVVCVGCGSCAAVCPTGAIEIKEDASTRTIWEKVFDLALCKKCGAVMGTAFELYRAANRAEAEPSDLCDKCKKKTITDVLAVTFGRLPD